MIKKFGDIIIFVLILLGLGAMAFIVSISKPIVQLDQLTISIGLLILIIFILYSSRIFEKFEFENDYIIVTNRITRAINRYYLEDILYYFEEIKKDDKNKVSKILNIYFERKRIKINSNYNIQYKAIKERIVTANKYEDIVKLNNLTQIKNLGIGLLVSTFIFCIIFFDNRNNNSNVIAVSYVLASKPVLIKGSKGSRSINLNIKNYGYFDFTISGQNYKNALNTEIVDDLNTNDTIFLTISQEDYEQKLNQIKPIQFKNRFFSYYHITVYGLSHKDKEYIKMDF